MLGNPGTYANKKRKKPVLKQKKVSDGVEVVKSNPSKRHRDRLNGELDRLMDLLPFSQDVQSRLDKLSVLRLSVGFLRVKSYFRATMKKSSSPSFPAVNGQNANTNGFATLSEGEMLLQALNGFVMVVTSNGSVFYASPTIKDYLGFHQSDVVHQSAFDLIHTDDRTMFREQLHFALNPPPEAEELDTSQGSGSSLSYQPDQLPPENSSFLERSFICRFRCLLDNSSGFLALKFQGRLKYLHNQGLVNRGGQPTLALFAIAMPVQPPAIVEIRAKMLLFQTKHRLDFTPTGVDSRGKIILGYSEMELCMKGSGYQFIHAADMMYCADNHIRMIKTGESGLTVFRLLTKSSGWVWVKSNAKLIYKGGRPEFIIAYQKALSNAEGEAYLCQRGLQLPFGFTTGEAVLYSTGPTVDVSQFHLNKNFQNGAAKPATLNSLVDCILSQDEAIYTQPANTPPLPVDEVFTDSRALLSITSNVCWEIGDTASEPLAVKEEDKRSMAAVLGGLEKMAGSGELGAALQNLEVDDAALVELEDALHFLSQEQHGQGDGGGAELDAILSSNMFDFIDSVLFKETDYLDSAPPSCLSGVDRSDSVAPTPLGQPQIFPNAACNYSPANGRHQPGMVNGGGVSGDFLSSQVFPQKLSNHGPPPPPANTNLPPLHQLQLEDIFSPSIELPMLAIPPLEKASPFQSCQQGTASHIHRGPAHLQESSPFPLSANRVAPHVSAPRPNADSLPPLIPCRDSAPSSAAPCLQERLQFETCPQKLNGFHTAAPSLQTADHQTVPCGGSWPQQHQQGAPPSSGQSSCMFEQRFTSGPAGGSGVQPHLASSSLSPAPASCYYQWGRSQPVVGTAVISQENVNISPLTAARNMQAYQVQQNGGEHSELFMHPSADVHSFLME